MNVAYSLYKTLNWRWLHHGMPSTSSRSTAVLVCTPHRTTRKSSTHSNCGYDSPMKVPLLKPCIIQGRSCRKALSLLERGQTSLDAIQEAVSALEADGCLNAGARFLSQRCISYLSRRQGLGQILR